MPTSTVKPIKYTTDLLKIRRHLRVLGFDTWLVGCCLFLFCGSVRSQTISARIVIDPATTPRVRIELDLPETSHLSFRNSYGSALGLATRIQSLEAIGSSGQRELGKQAAPGQYTFDQPVRAVTYAVDLVQPKRPGHLAQVSWLGADYGLLFLADLFPRLSESTVRVKLELRAGWNTTANVEQQDGQFVTNDADNAVFVVARGLREKNDRVDQTSFTSILVDSWPISTGDIVDVAKEILREHSSVTEYQLKQKSYLILLPFPGGAAPNQWSAETRGNTVVLLLGSNGRSKQVLARLSVVLSHELFHLWVPNALSLEGDYDWFFEGFTLYRALRADLKLGLISFEEFLNTIGRAYISYLNSPQRDAFTLLEASERRWTMSSPVVYDKGLLVAFIYDLMVRARSTCRSNADDLYARVFRSRTAGQPNGNETIIGLLSGEEDGKFVVDQYIQGKKPIDLERILARYGIQLNATGKRNALSVASNLNREQKNNFKCLKSGN